MKIIPTHNFPPLPNIALAVWPFIFVREDVMIGVRTINHEAIHGRQQVETFVFSVVFAIVLALLGCGWWSLIVLPLYYYIYAVLYVVCRVWALLTHRTEDDAYHRNPMEREAYDNEADMDYLDTRRPFAWVPYIWKN